MSRPTASIIVLNYNGREHLGPCLGSLARDGWPSKDVEVLVVDNGSSDGSELFVRTEHPRVRWIAAGSNLGFAGGIAHGVERSGGDTLVFLNNDTWVHRGWLDHLVGALDRAPAEVAAVTGRILDWRAERIDYHDTLVVFDGHAFQADFGRAVARVAEDPPGTDRLAPCGGNMAIRRRDFLDVGGFAPDFFAYLEDVDLGLRLRSEARRVIYEPAATISHRSGATGTALGIYNRGFLIEKNAFSVVWRCFDDEFLAAWLPAVLLTLTHRTERIVRETSERGELMTRDPYRSSMQPSAPVPAGRRQRLLRWIERLLGQPAQLPQLTRDELTAGPHGLSQLRALHRIAVDLPRLEQERRRIASRRRLSCREIFADRPLAIVPTYPGDDELFGGEAFARLLPVSLPHRRLALQEVMEGVARG